MLLRGIIKHYFHQVLFNESISNGRHRGSGHFCSPCGLAHSFDFPLDKTDCANKKFELSVIFHPILNHPGKYHCGSWVLLSHLRKLKKRVT